MLPWGEMLRAALAAGIAPSAFWRLSLREWRWLAAGADEALSRADFEQLQERCDDRD
ncbi:MAG: phage tail assembly chaperone [Pseudomonadota bacterium]